MTSPRLQWFLDRVGKKVYPALLFDNCFLCNAQIQTGIDIPTVRRAEILCEIETDGHTKYFDTKEEAEQFKNTEQ